jgi:hypothetical protein
MCLNICIGNLKLLQMNRTSFAKADVEVKGKKEALIKHQKACHNEQRIPDH